MARERKFLVGDEWRTSTEKVSITNPYNGQLVTEVYQAQKNDMEDAIRASERAFQTTRSLPSYRRAEILANIAQEIAVRKEDLARVIATESGKPIQFCRAEVDRAAMTFTIASEEAKRMEGEILPLDLTSHSEHRYGLVRKFPIGPISAISPFNFPINLIAHKAAPCIASGNTMVLKPPPQCPSAGLILGEIAMKAGSPPGAFNVLPCPVPVAEQLATDERFKMLSFTGSPRVGWSLKSKAGKKKVLLELGGNAGVIIDRTANLDVAVKRNVVGSFANAGQICIKVQRIFIQNDLYKEFLARFLDETKRLKVGDPLEDDTIVGPMIDPMAAERVESWIEEAVAGGAEVLSGGKRKGAMVEPTVLANVKRDMKVYCQEVFGPVVTVDSFKSFDEAIAKMNDTVYGLQAGVYSNDFNNIFAAFEKLEVGGVIVNDYPTYRIDSMPYGGIKDSGFGREGLKYAMDAMTELKLLALNFV
ncbi:MAG TPA: aldehyde dehydrogenase family protein [Bacteroidota bacterium]